jgi:hypothetical protein
VWCARNESREENGYDQVLSGCLPNAFRHVNTNEALALKQRLSDELSIENNSVEARQHQPGENMATRRVQFWRINDEFGSPLDFKFPGKRVTKALRDADTAGVSRYFDCRDGVGLLAEAPPEDAARPGLALYNRRSVNLPRQERDGVISDLGLDRRANLAEATFVSFFPRNIVGVLYNHQGPAASRLPEYLAGRLGMEVSVSPVFRKDAYEVLARMDMSKLSIAVDANQAHLLMGGTNDFLGGVAQIVDEAGNYSQGGTVEFSWSVGSRGTLEQRGVIRENIHTMALALARSTGLNHFRKAKAEGRDGLSGEGISVDIVNERLVHAIELGDEERGDVAQLTSAAFASVKAAWQASRGFLESEFEEVTTAASADYVQELRTYPER